ncbi:lactate utilization protein [bacterium]|nr:MAG: lactate utilization protein [bacterium]
MNEWSKWKIEKQLEKTSAALEKNGFSSVVCENGTGAAKLVMGFAKGAQTIGFGGSMTVAGLNLPGKLADAGKECLNHSAPGLAPEERLAIMRRQLTSDLFLTGVGAVTLDGKLVNIDATGNRVGAMTFGPKKVIVLAGFNKLVPDVEEGIKRIRMWAAPPNAKRIGAATPCVETGFCSDCDSPQRICRVVHIMEKKPRMTDITVILIAESMGL